MTEDEIIISETRRYRMFRPDVQQTYLQELGQIAMGVTPERYVGKMNGSVRKVAARLFKILTDHEEAAA